MPAPIFPVGAGVRTSVKSLAPKTPLKIWPSFQGLQPTFRTSGGQYAREMRCERSWFGAKLVGRYVKQLEHNALGVGDRVPERLHMTAGVDEAVAALMRKERKDFAGGGRLALSGFGVNRKRFELVSDHGLAKLALEQGVNRDGDEE